MASIQLPFNTWLPAPCSQLDCPQFHHERDSARFHTGLYVKVKSVIANALEVQVRSFYIKQENTLVPYKGIEDTGNKNVEQILELYEKKRITYRDGSLTEAKVRAAVDGWMIKVTEVPTLGKTSRQISDPEIISFFQQGNQEGFLGAIQKIVPNLNQSQPDLLQSEFNGIIRYMLNVT